VHCGDTIYADGPIPERRTTKEGRVWENLVTPEVAKVAETLDEFRGRYRYNLLDENIRRFGAEVPQVWLWDDHEVVNNWSGSKDLSGDDRYVVKDVPLLVYRGRRAFLDYAPLRPAAGDEDGRIYRRIAYGDLLDVFVLDMRSYRGPNTFNRQARAGTDTRFLGEAQRQWLKHELARSTAVWKVVAADMPLGLQVRDGVDGEGRPRFENIANGDGPVLGREFELAELLRHIRDRRIVNVVWVTADVHYCAAHRYDPAAARFRDFEPFWEFVAGPLNAGSFGPAQLDDTFGPEVVFQRVPPVQNASPFAGFQSFGQADIDRRTATLTIRLKDIDGNVVFTQELEAARADRG
jgi:alkaline phosphatase D